LKLHSYVVSRDFGFAPNPFYGVCTLATCKPVIRRTAAVGDWIVGTGSARNKRQRYLVFAMKVREALTFDEYWIDPRFQWKKPKLVGSKRLAYGDNIYHRSAKRHWIQETSHHSHSDGSQNLANIKNDTQTNRVLIGADFVYWGGSGPLIPSQFRQPDSDIRAVRGHKNNFSVQFVEQFVQWFKSQPGRGYIDRPWDWRSRPKILRK
jgi:hypothetical protein